MAGSDVFEDIYRSLVIEFQLKIGRPLLRDEVRFIEWVAMKACEDVEICRVQS
ncbi:hypothetical protein [Bacillus sp. Marseille-Q3570]|uniref:hypothetical protein n=1 Tax=Bacillus sp. Marseille-Q3570 TaxID=2963522 RepID=UPI0021B80834|nr:hypothetical protein [Bacillus sp. Marseille-Q3570]